MMDMNRFLRPASAATASLALLLMLSFTGCKSTAPAADANAQNPAPPAGAAGQSAPARRAPAAPRTRTVTLTIAAGQNVHVRVNEGLSSKTSNVGEGFTGELTAPLATKGGSTVFPKGAPVSGDVVASKGQGRIKGAGVLAIELKEIDGHPVTATEYVVTEKGKGKRSAALIGGGAGAGAVIGGLAGGAKGAVIGGLIGGGAGTAGAAYTGNKELKIPSESVVVFELSQPLTVTVKK